jgi:tRNA(Ile)-lysidine synthase
MMQRDTPFDSGRLLATLRELPAARVYWVGYSGGADSTALLHAIKEIEPSLNASVRALHINHGLHGDAASWQSHCEKTCLKLGVQIECHSVQISGKSGSGIEAEARRLRYEVVETVLNTGEIFLTAHHRDDQAETLLLNLVRGSGVDGLAGMPVSRPLGQGFIVRPMLDYPVTSLRKYLSDNKCNWLEDPSNEDQSYDRNFVRHSLIPEIEEKWPGAAERMARSTQLCREASIVLAQWADGMLSKRLLHPRILDLAGLDDRNGQSGLLVRRWLKASRAAPMPARVLQELLRQSAHANSQSQVRVAWEGWEIHALRQQLWLQESSTVQPCPKMEWQDGWILNIGGGIGSLEFVNGKTPFPGQLRIAPRQGGELIQLANGNARRPVKDILREAGIPHWLRASIPMVFDQHEVLAIADIAISNTLAKWLAGNQCAWLWQPEDALLKFAHQQHKFKAVDGIRTTR